MARTARRQAKNALLRARIPFKGHLVATAWRGYERYVGLRDGRDPSGLVNGVAVPPPQLRVRVAGTADRTWFLQTGLAHFTFLRTLLSDAGHPIDEMGSVLDFGCGCGRMLRWWCDISGPAIHGCDYNRELVRWCDEHLGFAQVQANELAPPLPYEDEAFELLYALSIFTHLSTELAQQWLTEMHRVTKPGGFVWFTAHGEALADRLSADERASFDAGDIVVHFPEVTGMNLCSTFWPEPAVRRMLTGRFEVVSRFDPLADPVASEDARMSHDAYLVRRL